MHFSKFSRITLFLVMLNTVIVLISCDSNFYGKQHNSLDIQESSLVSSKKSKGASSLISNKVLSKKRKYTKDTIIAVINLDDLNLDALQGVYLYKNKLFTGKAVTFHRGTMLLKQEITFDKGIKEGVCSRWFLNGQLSSQVSYIKGKIDGYQHTWWKNGLLRSQGYYKDGIAQGSFCKWYDTGNLFKHMNLVDGKEEGLQRAWRNNGKLYSNYEVINGRNFGLKRAKLCYELKDQDLITRKIIPYKKRKG